MEIKCKTEIDAYDLKRELQQNQSLNRTLVVINKNTPTHKMILLGVPEKITGAQIEENIQHNYYAREDEVKILTSFKSRRTPDAKDWILVMPRGLGKAIIATDGLTLGLKFCRLRPHTSVQRCTKCQSFDHDRRRCRNKDYCPICGESHEPSDCNKPRGCVNCKAHNNDEGTKYKTNHSASDPTCPVFQAAYAYERERLDSLFSQNLYVEPPVQEEFRHEDFNHLPRSSAWDWAPIYQHWPLPPQEETYGSQYRAGQMTVLEPRRRITHR